MKESKRFEVTHGVPHTVISLPSGQTLAFGRSPRPADVITQDVESAIEALVRLEVNDEEPHQDRIQSYQSAVELISRANETVSRMLADGSKSHRDLAFWAAPILSRVSGLLATVRPEE